MALAPILQPGSVVALAALEASRIGSVKALLRDLPVDYPGADQWLDRRLTDVQGGSAECWVALNGLAVVGLTILTPKPNALKLSTIFVDEPSRGYGVGSLLMRNVIGAATRLDRDEIYVTVAEHKVHQLQSLLQAHGFTKTAVEEDRYGPNRTEVVFTRLGT